MNDLLTQHKLAVIQAVDDLIAEIEKDQKIDDDEGQAIADMMQEIHDKLADLLAKYGMEFGDERVD